MILPCLFVTMLATKITMKRNVLFNKIDDVAMTTAKWRVTLVTGLRPYDSLLANTLNYITQIENISKHTVQAHYIGKGSNWMYIVQFSEPNGSL